MIELNEAYASRFEEAKKYIESQDFFRIFSHYDADGVSSAIIISESLRRLRKKFHLSFIGYEERGAVEESAGSPIILSDLGADIIENLKESKVLLVDHHIISDLAKDEIINLNPRSYGYDGTREACSSTAAFILSLTLDENNRDLFPVFIAGAIGDKQNVGGYKGINSLIIESVKDLYSPSTSLNLSGETISEAIYLSIDPYFEGLSGNFESSREFVKKTGIDPDAILTNLGTDEKEKLVDSLMLSLLKQSVSREGYDALVAEDFTFNTLGLSGSQLYDYFDSSGRNGRMGLPASWFMGNEDAKEEMHGIWLRFRKEALEQTERSMHSRKSLENIHVTYVENPSLTGTVAGILMVYLYEKNKPVLVLCRNKEVKISSRATRELVLKGIDLSSAISAAASQNGGHGGGHDIAAGGEVPLDKEEDFLTKMDGIIGEQIGNTEKSPKV